MADERVVAIKLEQIEQYHGELSEKQQTLSKAAFLRSTTQQRAVERMFENAIQACSDLAQQSPHRISATTVVLQNKRFGSCINTAL